MCFWPEGIAETYTRFQCVGGPIYFWFTLCWWYYPDTCGASCQGLISKYEGFTEASPWQSVDFNFCPCSLVRLSEVLLIFSPLSHFWSQQMPIAEKSTLKFVFTSPQVHLHSYLAAILFYCLASWPSAGCSNYIICFYWKWKFKVMYIFYKSFILLIIRSNLD